MVSVSHLIYSLWHSKNNICFIEKQKQKIVWPNLFLCKKFRIKKRCELGLLSRPIKMCI